MAAHNQSPCDDSLLSPLERPPKLALARYTLALSMKAELLAMILVNALLACYLFHPISVVLLMVLPFAFRDHANTFIS